MLDLTRTFGKFLIGGALLVLPIKEYGINSQRESNKLEIQTSKTFQYYQFPKKEKIQDSAVEEARFYFEFSNPLALKSVFTSSFLKYYDVEENYPGTEFKGVKWDIVLTSTPKPMKEIMEFRTYFYIDGYHEKEPLCLYSTPDMGEKVTAIEDQEGEKSLYVKLNELIRRDVIKKKAVKKMGLSLKEMKKINRKH